MSWLLWTVLLQTLGCMHLFELEFSPDICSGVGFLDHIYIYIFGLFSMVTALVYISTSSVEASLSSPSTAFVFCRVFHGGTKILPWGSTIRMFEEHKLPWEVLASSLSAFHSLFLASPVITWPFPISQCALCPMHCYHQYILQVCIDQGGSGFISASFLDSIYMH